MLVSGRVVVEGNSGNPSLPLPPIPHPMKWNHSASSTENIDDALQLDHTTSGGSCLVFWCPQNKGPPGKKNISHQTGKGESFSKMALRGDMLVPWRVLGGSSHLVVSNPHLQAIKGQFGRGPTILLNGTH